MLEERNGITVVLHFAQDSPRPDVSVVVITTMSKNAKPLSNYLFQAVVPKVNMLNDTLKIPSRFSLETWRLNISNISFCKVLHEILKIAKS